MYVFLLRHGECEETGALYTQDHTRPLTIEGEESIERIGRNLHALIGGFPLILTCPMLRTRQSAEIIAEQCEYLRPIQSEETLNGYFEPEQIANRIASLSDYPAVLLVGLSPCFDELAAYYITGDESTRIPFQPGTLGVLEVPDPASHTGVLRALIPEEVWSQDPPEHAPFLNLQI